MRRLYQENVIQLLDSFETNNEFCLVTELAQGQLYEILEEDKKLPEKEIRKIAMQLVAGLFYLHSNNVIHRDIKPQNVLISANGIIKICDFGFARAIENKAMITSIKGTPLYMAPELLKEYPYNQKADLWSLGVILYELFVGQPPFYTNNFPTLMNKIVNDNVKYPESMTFQFKDFLKGLLVKNPKERCDWNRILDHPFIKENEEEKEERLRTQENYKKWIIRLKNEKVFNLYECEAFLSKFANDSEVDSGIRNFSAFEASDKPLSGTGNISSKRDRGSNEVLRETFWIDMDNKANSEEGASLLRKDPEFSEKVSSALKNLINYETEKVNSSSDKKLISFIVRILFTVLTKGKFENQNIDITKNQEILKGAMAIFSSVQADDNNTLLNDTIKVIGLFAKFYCYYSTPVDLTFCAGFIKLVPNVFSHTSRPSNIQINLVKAVGIMITAANMVPKRSLMFYRTFYDFQLIRVLFNIIKGYKNNYLLVKSAVECLAISLNPMNGDILPFPLQKFNDMNNQSKNDPYIEYKTTFEHIEKIKSNFMSQFIQEAIYDILPVLFELDNDVSLKSAILRVTSIMCLDFTPTD